MRRYASIDFLRGTAMVLMIFLHVVSDVLDYNSLLPQIDTVNLLQILALIIIPFLGGLAGFFLMVSAIGNMVSMYRQLQSGKPVRELVVRQVIGGFLLVAFGMLTEGVLGRYGIVGQLWKAIPNLANWNWSVGLYRGYYFETIQAIGWCIVVNGIVQGILSRNNQWKNTKKMVKRYALLAVVVLALTPLMWWVAGAIVPGYPYAINPLTNGHISPDPAYVMFPYVGITPWYDFITLFFMGPLAGLPEPIFPYLAASFLGSIVGVWMSQERSAVPRKFPRQILMLTFIMFIIGMAGLIINVAMMAEVNLDQALQAWIYLWDHHYWIPENGVPVLGWLFQFLALNGTGLAAIVLVIRLVEFRGKGKRFAEKTTSVRRYGFIAFSIYAYQWLWYFAWVIVSSIVATPYALLDWNYTFLTIAISYGFFQVVLLLWERIKYVGSLEWCIAIIASKIIPGKKPKGSRGDLLAVNGAFYNVEWLNIVEEGEINHPNQADSTFAAHLAPFGFLFPPISFMALLLANKAAKIEQPNRYNRRAKILAIAGIVFFIAWLVFACLFSLSDLGLSL